jgi:glycosyltransferase involved in cell wall biosynthesis
MIDGLGIGGAESHLISLLNVFDYTSYRIDLQMYRRNGPLEKFLPQEVKVLPALRFFENPKRLWKQSLRFLYSRFKFGIGRRINKLKTNPWHDSQIFWKYYSRCIDKQPDEYDIAVAFGQGFPCYYVAEKTTAHKKILSINMDIHSAGYDSVFNEFFFSAFDHILPVSVTLKQKLESQYEKFSSRMSVFENTFSLALIERMAGMEKAFTDECNGLRIVSIGRLVPQKGFDLAIKAASILKKNQIEFKWHIVGGGFLYDALQKQIIKSGLENIVILEGYQENPYKYLAHADLYVQTSINEGFCRTIKEAKVFGLAVISTDFPAVHEQIIHEYNGLIVDIDEKNIATGISRLLNDPVLKNRLRNNMLQEKFRSGKEEFAAFEKFLT